MGLGGRSAELRGARAFYDAGYLPYEGERVAELSPNDSCADDS